MNIVVLGMWHLGCVTAACLADQGLKVKGLEFDATAISQLQKGVLPIFEPGLDDLVANGAKTGNLVFSDDVSIITEADILWVAYDTPVDSQDRADVEFVIKRIERCMPYLTSNSIVIVSSQLPVGSIAELEKRFAAVSSNRTVHFVSWPENLRLGQAIKVFKEGDRVVIGARSQDAVNRLMPMATLLAQEVISVSVESAEMSKHAMNAFLATCVTFSNELASICEQVGADAQQVERTIRADPRAGRHAYLRAGGPFAGGTLARDVRFLEDLGASLDLPSFLIKAIIQSNQDHMLWAHRRLAGLFGDSLKSQKVCVLGLAYKPGTDTLRRSSSVALIDRLIEIGTTISAFDPKVMMLPDKYKGKVALAANMDAAMKDAKAIVIATAWPEFKNISKAQLADCAPNAFVLDQERLLGDDQVQVFGDKYVTVGKPV